MQRIVSAFAALLADGGSTMQPVSRCCLALVAAACLITPASGTDLCLDFDYSVDALELTITGDRITGRWLNYDSYGNDSTIRGVIRGGLPRPCTPGRSTNPEGAQNPPQAGIACIWDEGCEGVVAGWDWYIFLDGLDGSLDIGSDAAGDDGPPGHCAADDIPYTIILGPCPSAGWRLPEGHGMAVQEAIRAKLDQQ